MPDSIPAKGMTEGGTSDRAVRPQTRPITYCVVPAGLAEKLHEPLRAHFRGDSSVEVVVESRRADRRSGADRRGKRGEPRGRRERRRILATAGRRVAERRAEQHEAEPPALPRKARRHAAELRFIRRLEPSTEQAEDADTARLVMRFQAGERDAYSTLYARYFERVYSYLLVVMKKREEAEDLAQNVFTDVLERLPEYERRETPFRAWLFTVARNQALTRLSRQGKLELMEPAELAAIRERDEDPQIEDARVFDWLTDRDLTILVERLTLPQRQVLALRFVLDLPADDIGRLLGRSAEDVRTLQHRALRYLEERMTALGRTPATRGGTKTQEGMLRDIKPATVLRSRRFSLWR